MSNSRLKQNSHTGVIRPTVELVSMTQNPVGTVFSMWYGSRHSDSIPASLAENIYKGNKCPYYNKASEVICKEYPEHAGQDKTDSSNVIKKVVSQVIKADLPPTESVLFTFVINNASVAWREQLVRSKIASYWTQTSRTQDLSTMDVNMNESIELLGGSKAVAIYEETVDFIRRAYAELASMGVPAEDIRLQPQGHTHRVYWMITLRSLIKIINKRCDWIAQSSLWSPIISGVCNILRVEGLMPVISDFIGKPFATVEYYSDFDEYKVTGHTQDTENEDRYYGRDPLPVDPLYLAYKGYSMPEHTNLPLYDYMKSLFIHIWQDEYLQVLGWDRDHPEKLGKYDRPVVRKKEN